MISTTELGMMRRLASLFILISLFLATTPRVLAPGFAHPASTPATDSSTADASSPSAHFESVGGGDWGGGGGSGGSWDSTSPTASISGVASLPTSINDIAHKPTASPPGSTPSGSSIPQKTQQKISAAPSFQDAVQHPGDAIAKLRASLEKPAGGTSGTSSGTGAGTGGAGTPGTKPQIGEKEWNGYTEQQKLDYLLKARQEQDAATIQEIVNDYKDNKAKPDELDRDIPRITKLANEPGRTEKEKEQILNQLRTVIQQDHGDIPILRELSQKSVPFENLPQNYKFLYKDKTTYDTALNTFKQTRNILIQNSAGMFDSRGNIIQVYDAKSWESLSEAQKGLFSDDPKNPTPFLQAQSEYAKQNHISEAEDAYLHKRQDYISLHFQLEDLRSKRASAKTPEDKKLVEQDIATLQSKVDGAYNQYVALQPQALAAAYQRRSDDLKKEIETLDQDISGMDPGSKRSEAERKLASKMAEQRQMDFKARDAVGKLTFAEKLNAFVSAYSEFSGLGQYTSLFIDDKDLAKRRKEAEDAFCDTILLGGTNCWTSKICQGNIDATIGGTGIVGSAATGEPRGAARIQADKSQPAIIHNETTHTDTTLFLYHIEYFLQNINDEPMKYNLIFYATEGPTVRAFVKDKEIPAGGTESRIRTTAIVRYSEREYETACLSFNPSISYFDGGTTNEVCTDLTMYQGGPTSIPGAIPTPTEQAGSGTASPSGNQPGGGGGSSRPPQDFDGF